MHRHSALKEKIYHKHKNKEINKITASVDRTYQIVTAYRGEKATHAERMIERKNGEKIVSFTRMR